LPSVVVVVVAAGTVIRRPPQVSVAVLSSMVQQFKSVEQPLLVQVVQVAIQQIKVETVWPIQVQVVVAVDPINALEAMVVAVAASSRWFRQRARTLLPL
jgi:hypothetical protein